MIRQSTSLCLPGKDRRGGVVIRTFGMLLLLAIACPGAARALDPDDLPNAIDNAETPADHEALAAYYEEEAKTARAMAERHRSMGERYRNPHKPAGLKGVRARSMPQHCDKLVASYEAAAKEYEAMAAAHREAASAIE
jgi:hypothetical protein